MQGKLEEIFTERGNFDTRKVLNLSHRSIPPDTLRSIEENGVTLEHLEMLGVPVCKYKTQITLHGTFPELAGNDWSKGRVGGYKSLIRNQNGSLGVRYIAVDRIKKETVYTALHFCGWSIQSNSTEFFAYRSTPFVQTRQELATHLETLKAELTKINTTLFHGSARLSVYAHPFFGYYAALILDLGCFPSGNEPAIVENVTGKTLQSIEAEIETKSAADEAEYQAQEIEIQKERAEYAAKLEIEHTEIAAKYGLTHHAELEPQAGVFIVKGEISGSYFVRRVYADKFRRFRKAWAKFETLEEAARFVRSGKLPEPTKGDKVITHTMRNVYTV
jgi:hypothetical protein